MGGLYQALERADRLQRRDLDGHGRLTAGEVEAGPGSPSDFEKARMALALAAQRAAARSIVLVSALPGEGVTFVAHGLARAMAAGARQGVLLITLRRDGGGRPGLAEVLRGDRGLADVVARTTASRLQVLGPGRANADLTQESRLAAFARFLEGIEREFDHVLVDGGALESSTEGLCLASRAGGAVLVVRAERTGIAAVRDAHAALLAAGATFLGVILNRPRRYIPRFIDRRL